MTAKTWPMTMHAVAPEQTDVGCGLPAGGSGAWDWLSQ
jgi:hypothetical protein